MVVVGNTYIRSFLAKRLNCLYLFTLYACSVFVFFVPQACADISWLEGASDCQSFSDGVVKFYKELGDLNTLSLEKKHELEKVISRACSSQFSQCGFDICPKNEISDREVLDEARDVDKVSANSSSDGAINDSLELPQGWGQPLLVDSQSSNSQASSVQEGSQPSNDQSTDVYERPVQSRRLIEEDPLAKWTKELTCDEFKDQFRALYGPLLGPGANFENLPRETQEEINKVKELACSPQYAKCAFRSCTTDVQMSPELTYEEQVKNRADAEKKLAEQFAEFKSRRKEAIVKRVKLEADQGISWQRISVRQELVGEEQQLENTEQQNSKTIRNDGADGSANM